MHLIVLCDTELIDNTEVGVDPVLNFNTELSPELPQSDFNTDLCVKKRSTQFRLPSDAFILIQTPLVGITHEESKWFFQCRASRKPDTCLNISYPDEKYNILYNIQYRMECPSILLGFGSDLYHVMEKMDKKLGLLCSTHNIINPIQRVMYAFFDLCTYLISGTTKDLYTARLTLLTKKTPDDLYSILIKIKDTTGYDFTVPFDVDTKGVLRQSVDITIGNLQEHTSLADSMIFDPQEKLKTAYQFLSEDDKSIVFSPVTDIVRALYLIGIQKKTQKSCRDIRETPDIFKLYCWTRLSWNTETIRSATDSNIPLDEARGFDSPIHDASLLDLNERVIFVNDKEDETTHITSINRMNENNKNNKFRGWKFAITSGISAALYQATPVIVSLTQSILTAQLFAGQSSTESDMLIEQPTSLAVYDQTLANNQMKTQIFYSNIWAMLTIGATLVAGIRSVMTLRKSGKDAQVLAAIHDTELLFMLNTLKANDRLRHIYLQRLNEYQEINNPPNYILPVTRPQMYMIGEHMSFAEEFIIRSPAPKESSIRCAAGCLKLEFEEWNDKSSSHTTTPQHLIKIYRTSNTLTKLHWYYKSCDIFYQDPHPLIWGVKQSGTSNSSHNHISGKPCSSEIMSSTEPAPMQSINQYIKKYFFKTETPLILDKIYTPKFSHGLIPWLVFVAELLIYVSQYLPSYFKTIVFLSRDIICGVTSSDTILDLLGLIYDIDGVPYGMWLDKENQLCDIIVLYMLNIISIHTKFRFRSPCPTVTKRPVKLYAISSESCRSDPGSQIKEILLANQPYYLTRASIPMTTYDILLWESLKDRINFSLLSYNNHILKAVQSIYPDCKTTELRLERHTELMVNTEICLFPFIFAQYSILDEPTYNVIDISHNKGTYPGKYTKSTELADIWLAQMSALIMKNTESGYLNENESMQFDYQRSIEKSVFIETVNAILAVSPGKLGETTTVTLDLAVVFFSRLYALKDAKGHMMSIFSGSKACVFMRNGKHITKDVKWILALITYVFILLERLELYQDKIYFLLFDVRIDGDNNLLYVHTGYYPLTRLQAIAQMQTISDIITSKWSNVRVDAILIQTPACVDNTGPLKSPSYHKSYRNTISTQAKTIYEAFPSMGSQIIAIGYRLPINPPIWIIEAISYYNQYNTETRKWELSVQSKISDKFTLFAGISCLLDHTYIISYTSSVPDRLFDGLMNIAYTDRESTVDCLFISYVTNVLLSILPDSKLTQSLATGKNINIGHLYNIIIAFLRETPKYSEIEGEWNTIIKDEKYIAVQKELLSDLLKSFQRDLKSPNSYSLYPSRYVDSIYISTCVKLIKDTTALLGSNIYSNPTISKHLESLQSNPSTLTADQRTALLDAIDLIYVDHLQTDKYIPVSQYIIDVQPMTSTRINYNNFIKGKYPNVVRYIEFQGVRTTMMTYIKILCRMNRVCNHEAVLEIINKEQYFLLPQIKLPLFSTS